MAQSCADTLENASCLTVSSSDLDHDMVSNLKSSHLTYESRTGFITAAEAKIVDDVCNYVIISMTTFGLLTNTLNFVVFVRIGIAKNSTNISFFALTMCDTIFLATTLLIKILTLFSQTEIGSRFASTIAYILLPFWLAFYTVGSLITVYLSVQKCCCVAMPLNFQELFTPHRSIIIMTSMALVILALCAGWSSGVRLTWQGREATNSTYLVFWLTSSEQYITPTFQTLVRVIVPTGSQVIIVICLIVLVIKLRESSRFRKSLSKEKTENPKAAQLSDKELQAATSVALITVMFVICNFPVVVMTYAAVIEPEFNDLRKYGLLYGLMNQLVSVLQVTCSSCNFFIYYKYNSAFRSRISECVCCKEREHLRILPLDVVSKNPKGDVRTPQEK